MEFGRTMLACMLASSLTLGAQSFVRDTVHAVVFNSPVMRAERQAIQNHAFMASLQGQTKRPFEFVRFKNAGTCFAIGYDASMFNRGGAMTYYLPPDDCQKIADAGAKFVEIDELPTPDAGIAEIPDGGTSDIMVPDAH